MTSDVMNPPVFSIGDIEVRRIVEIYAPFKTPEEMFPQDAEAARAAVDAARAEIEPWALDPATGKFILVVQSYVLRTTRHTIVVDTCVGCHKSYPTIPPWHQRTDDSWLTRLTAAGVDPSAVDYVLCTHLHGDHVGWNTRRVDGRWEPTFPNATYLMTSIDEAFIKEARPATYEESVSPVIMANQARLVDTEFLLDDEVRLERTPGHTPGHVAVRLRSKGQEALLTGDVFHCHLQCAHPEWRFFSDADPAQAAITRRRLFDAHCETGRLILPAHLPAPTIGRIARQGDAYRFEFIEM